MGTEILIHTIDYPNKYTETHITPPYLKLRAEVENFGNDTDVILRSGSVECGRSCFDGYN